MIEASKASALESMLVADAVGFSARVNGGECFWGSIGFRANGTWCFEPVQAQGVQDHLQQDLAQSREATSLSVFDAGAHHFHMVKF